MDDGLGRSLRRIRETLPALERVDLRNHPTPEDIAQFHELHARHEAEMGRPERAAAAEARAERARQLKRWPRV